MESKFLCKSHKKEIIAICFSNCYQENSLCCYDCLLENHRKCNDKVSLEKFMDRDMDKILSFSVFKDIFSGCKLDLMKKVVNEDDILAKIEDKFTEIIDQIVGKLNEIKDQMITSLNKVYSGKEIKDELFKLFGLEEIVDKIHAQRQEETAVLLELNTLIKKENKTMVEFNEKLHKYEQHLEVEKKLKCLAYASSCAIKAFEETLHNNLTSADDVEMFDLSYEKLNYKEFDLKEYRVNLTVDYCNLNPKQIKWKEDGIKLVPMNYLLKPETGTRKFKINFYNFKDDDNLTVGICNEDSFVKHDSISKFLNETIKFSPDKFSIHQNKIKVKYKHETTYMLTFYLIVDFSFKKLKVLNNLDVQVANFDIKHSNYQPFVSCQRKGIEVEIK